MATGSKDEEDHYAILGLPSGEEGAKLSIKEIEKAYKIKARECHPDKRRNDPDATAIFQKLVSSFEILKNEAARKAFDDLLRARRERLLRESRHDSKRRKLATDLEERERAGVAGSGLDPVEKARREEAEAAARLKEELARFRAAMLAKKKAPPGRPEPEKDEVKIEGGVGLDKERVLKVTWERSAGEYTDAMLREVFGNFGDVEDVMLRSKGTKKKGSALIVMGTKAAAVAAVHSMVGNLSNPLLVLPLLSPVAGLSEGPPTRQPEADSSKLDKLVGRGYQDFEDSVLKKLQKAAERQR
ncbi:DNAJ heat shock N-terminal domain-containing protein isoform X2 [Wolffia australiana]